MKVHKMYYLVSNYTFVQETTIVTPFVRPS